jgi:hypothetical protein
MELKYCGTKVPRYQSTVVPEYRGTKVPRNQSTAGPIDAPTPIVGAVSSGRQGRAGGPPGKQRPPRSDDRRGLGIGGLPMGRGVSSNGTGNRNKDEQELCLRADNDYPETTKWTPIA